MCTRVPRTYVELEHNETFQNFPFITPPVFGNRDLLLYENSTTVFSFFPGTIVIDVSYLMWRESWNVPTFFVSAFKRTYIQEFFLY